MSTSPSPFVRRGAELRLSNPGQLALLQAVVARGVPLRTSVRGTSMTPFIRDGDVVTLAPLTSEPHVGDVVAIAFPGGRMAVHRLVARRGSGWLLRGDNCPQPDGVFPREALTARVVRVERGGRDVALGVRRGGASVAALSRCGWLGSLNAAVRLPRRAAGRLVRVAQGLPAYRRLVRRVGRSVTVRRAAEADLAVVRRRLGIETGGDAADNCTTLRWVASRGGRALGFVELADRRQAEGPWRGCWLFSLEVWPLWRGAGLGEQPLAGLSSGARAASEVNGAQQATQEPGAPDLGSVVAGEATRQ